MSNVAGRAATLLQASPGRALPLSVLHERLCADTGYAAGAATLLATLEHRTDLFTTVVPHSVVSSYDAWNPDERALYDTAFVQSGVIGEPRVALRASLEPAPHAVAGEANVDARLDAAEAAVLALWRQLDPEPRLRADLGHALAELDRMRARLRSSGAGRGTRLRRSATGRSTTPPQDPPPEP
jgi:hypothetical protein